MPLKTHSNVDPAFRDRYRISYRTDRPTGKDHSRNNVVWRDDWDEAVTTADALDNRDHIDVLGIYDIETKEKHRRKDWKRYV